MTNKYQVVVLGGSSSAIYFAIKSAERGYSTLLIEENNCIGGELSGRFTGNEIYNQKLIVNNNLLEEVLKEIKLTKNISFYNNLIFQNYFLKKFEELNISILFNTSIYKIRTTNNKIDHLIVSDGESLHVIELSLLADCSADLYSHQILNSCRNNEDCSYHTFILRFAGIDFVEALADVRENPENYSVDSSKKYVENDFLKLQGYKNVVEIFNKRKIFKNSTENLEFIFPPGIDEAMFTATSKTKLLNDDVDFIINQLKINCAGFRNIFATEIKIIEMEYFNSICLEEFQKSKPENIILQTNQLNETEKLNPLSIETQVKLFDYGVNISDKIESIIKK